MTKQTRPTHSFRGGEREGTSTLCERSRESSRRRLESGRRPRLRAMARRPTSGLGDVEGSTPGKVRKPPTMLRVVSRRHVHARPGVMAGTRASRVVGSAEQEGRSGKVPKFNLYTQVMSLLTMRRTRRFAIANPNGAKPAREGPPLSPYDG